MAVLLRLADPGIHQRNDDIGFLMGSVGRHRVLSIRMVRPGINLDAVPLDHRAVQPVERADGNLVPGDVSESGDKHLGLVSIARTRPGRVAEKTDLHSDNTASFEPRNSLFL